MARHPSPLELGKGSARLPPMTCDLLVIAPHPDDAELHLGATIARQIRLGATVVVVDCSQGESASRGTVAQRAAEAAAAAAHWGLQGRENLCLPDGGLNGSDGEQRRVLVDAIRRHRPRMVLSICDLVRHPDHRACHWLSRDAVKSAAIHGYRTASGATAHRVERLAFYEAECPIQPNLLVGVEEVDVATKLACLGAYHSQWGSSDGPPTAISQPAFLQWINQRGRAWGYHAGAPYAEALVSHEPWGIDNGLR